MSACYEANKNWAAWHRVTPAIEGSGKTRRLHLFSLNSAPNPMPHHPSVSILFLWPVLKGHTVSQDFHMPPFTLNPLPQLKVYLRLRFSDVEDLDVNIQSTSSLNTPIQREGKPSGSSSVENSAEHARQYKWNSCETLEDHTMQKYANFLFCCLITSFSKRWL